MTSKSLLSSFESMKTMGNDKTSDQLLLQEEAVELGIDTSAVTAIR